MNAPMQCETFANLEGIRHGFFTRKGGVSDGLYSSLNCGIGSQDEPPLVLENRSRVAARLGGTCDDVLSPYQVHGADALLVDRPWPTDQRPKVDGLVTSTPGLAIGILTADCGPVLFADGTHGVAGAAHAGWKGAIGGVLASTVAVMEAAGAQRPTIHAALGPTISQRSYEVGPEFREAFVDKDAASDRFFTVPPGQSRAHFDLPGFIVSQLKTLGLASVSDLATCTYEDETRFFSFRRATHRNERDYGRQISAILVT
ncbi:MAG: peptidoglycan editing factor PgeF [Hyphomicrobiaceae bacterium]